MTNRGSVAVEFALVLIPAITLLLGGFHVGLGMLYSLKLNFAVESAAKAYALGVVATDDDARNSAQTSAALPGDATIQDYAAGTADCGKWVSAAYLFDVVKLFPAITITARACYPAQAPANPA